MSVKKNCASPTKSLTARHWVPLRIAQTFEKPFRCRSNRTKLAFSLSQFYDECKSRKKAFAQADKAFGIK